MKKIRFTLAAGYFGAVAASSALASGVLFDELKRLRDQLPINDPQRGELGLRIADIAASDCLVTTTHASIRMSRCREATLLYQEALPVANASLKPKIQFQMARIAMERADFTTAKPLLEQALAASTSNDLKREAVFRLAEIAESQASTSTHAEAYYRQALELCSGTDSCSFANYRIAWIQKRDGKLSEAIETMKRSLFDSKGQPREEAIRDLIAFMGQDPGSADAHIAAVEALSSKLSQPQRLEELAHAYLSAGNKPSGVRALELYDSRTPKLLNQAKILEELYGMRDWDRFQSRLVDFERTANRAPQDASPEVEKICRRLAIQLDAERTTRPERAEEFKRLSMATLLLFPRSKDSSRIMEGWVAAEAQNSSKLAQLGAWLRERDRYALSVAQEVQLRELRSGIAQKEKDVAIVIDEARALVQLAESSKDSTLRAKNPEYRYALARALYERKEYDAALPLFREIAEEGRQSGSPDRFAVQAQHLALDILNQRKDWSALQAQAVRWTSDAILVKNNSLSQELNEMNEVASAAAFESAVALGETTEALERFTKFCGEKRFLPKSCENAKTLAVKLERHSDLISVLKITEPEGETLASELEAGGFFGESAALTEKRLGRSLRISDALKIALLYELAGNLSARDRVLNTIPAIARQAKTVPAEIEQMAVFEACRDARILQVSWVKMGWSEAFHVRVAEALESNGKGSPETKKIILAQPSSTGDAWNRYVLQEAQALYAVQSKIHFHRRDSQRQFQARVAALKKLNDYVQRAVGGAGSELRVQLLTLSRDASSMLAKEILDSPIPAGLNEEQMAQVRSGLHEMSQPFADQSTSVGALIESESAKAASMPVSDRVVTSASSVTMESELKTHLAALSKNPRDRAALAGLRDGYRAIGKNRLAMYFEGRLRL